MYRSRYFSIQNMWMRKIHSDADIIPWFHIMCWSQGFLLLNRAFSTITNVPWCSHRHPKTHACMYIQASIYSFIHTYIQVYMHTYKQTYAYTHAYKNAYMHTYIHTCTHTYIIAIGVYIKRWLFATAKEINTYKTYIATYAMHIVACAIILIDIHFLVVFSLMSSTADSTSQGEIFRAKLLLFNLPSTLRWEDCLIIGVPFKGPWLPKA